MTDNPMEELADMAVDCLREFIDTEGQFVKEEHDFHAKLLQWDNLLPHLLDLIVDDPESNNLFDIIEQKLGEIREIVETTHNAELSFAKEVEEDLEQIKQDSGNYNWRAVKKGLMEGMKDENAILKIELKELHHLHSRFIELMKLMKEAKVAVLNEDLTQPKQKHEYKKMHDYYFVEIYKFIRAYERIFRHIWKKEKELARELKKKSRKIK